MRILPGSPFLSAEHHLCRASRSRPKSLFRRLWSELLEPRLALAAIPAPSGLVAWWTGDGNAADYAGSNDGILEGGATFAPGKVGQAFSLDGIDDWIRVPNSATLDPTAGFTAEAWIKSESTAGPRVILSKWGQFSDSYIFKEHNDSDKLRIELTEVTCCGDLADLEGTTSIQVGQWTHVAFTYDTNTVRLYFNGILDSSLTVGPGRFIHQSVSDFVIGAFQIELGVPSENFKGLIDEVSLYNRALSDTEIQAIDLAGTAGKQKPMIVTGSTPAAGDTYSAPPTYFSLGFTFPYDAASVQASDLTVNGRAADSFTANDANTITFHYNTSPVTSDGTQTMQIAAGAITTAAGGASNPSIAAWTRTFQYGATTPVGGSTATKFVTSGLNQPVGLTFGPDGNLYVLSQGNNSVAHFNGSTGASIGTFASSGSGGLSFSHRAVFGPDGNLYITSGDTDSVLRYSGTTGAFLGTFVTASSGGLDLPVGLAFAPDGKLYVVSNGTNSVLRYNGSTGAFIDSFVSSGSGGLNFPTDLALGPDNNLYVSSWNNHRVLRYNGTTGAFLDTFVQANSGGLSSPNGLAFGSDGYLYVGGFYNDDVILRYNASTGAFVNTISVQGLRQAVGLTFGPDGALYVSSLGTNEVFRLNVTGSASPGPYAEDGTQRIDNFAQKLFSSVPPGGSQDLIFQTSSDRPGLFSVQPTIDSTGRLTYSPAPNVQGTAVVTVVKTSSSSGGEETAYFVITIVQRAPWQNDGEGEDVNDDGYVAPDDALLVIDYLNGVGSGVITDGNSNGPFFDASGDNFMSPFDALRIIDFINANDDGEGEGAGVGGRASGVGSQESRWLAGSGGDLLALLAMDVAGQGQGRRRVM